MLAKATDEQKDSLKKIWKWICNSYRAEQAE